MKKRFLSHAEQYVRSHFAVQIGDVWVKLGDCSCGSVHTYEIIDEPGPLSQIDFAALSEEYREHLTTKLQAMAVNRQLTLAVG